MSRILWKDQVMARTVACDDEWWLKRRKVLSAKIIFLFPKPELFVLGEEVLIIVFLKFCFCWARLRFSDARNLPRRNNEKYFFMVVKDFSQDGGCKGWKKLFLFVCSDLILEDCSCELHKTKVHCFPAGPDFVSVIVPWLYLSSAFSLYLNEADASSAIQRLRRVMQHSARQL